MTSETRIFTSEGASTRPPPDPLPSRSAAFDFTIVIPTLNAAKFAPKLLGGLRSQGIDLSRVVIIDSKSDDDTVAIFRERGCAVHSIARKFFDHGGTRNLGLSIAESSEIVIYLTQDAVPDGTDLITNVLAPFSDPSVALVYGRQIARDGAGAIEAHAREFNYPDKSAPRSMPTAHALGIKAVFNSNSFAAYRRSALLSVGGFPSRIIMGEDQVAAALLLKAGWTVVYEAEARVKHSHAYSLGQEFSRYFDIGVFHEQQRPLLSSFGNGSAEGRRFVASELKYLVRRTPMRIPEAAVRTAAKWLGYNLGKHYKKLPLRAARMLAMNKSFFLPPDASLPLTDGKSARGPAVDTK